MVKTKIFLYTLGLFLSLGIAASLSVTFAQDGVMNGQVAEPGTGATISETDTTGESMVYDTDTTPFNSAWLIPLVVIPLMVYLLWPKERDEFSSSNYGGSLAGMKGGKAKRDNSFLPENNKDITRLRI